MKEDNILNVLEKHKKSTENLEVLIKELKSEKLIKERDALLLENKKITDELEKIKPQLENLKKEKAILQSKIFDIYYNQKELDIKKAFKSVKNNKDKMLFEYEKEIYSIQEDYNNNINKKILTLKEENLLEIDDLSKKVEALSVEIDKMIENKQYESNKLSMEYDEELRIKREELASRELSEDEVKQKVKFASIEFTIGSKITNGLGILLIMIGLTYGVYLSYNFFGRIVSDEMKTLIIYIVGLILIGSGEFFKDKSHKTFSTGLFAGGVGVLYLGTAVGYFVFEGVLTSVTTIILIAVISTVSFLLATRNDMKPVAIFALIGGYMPLIELQLNENYITAIIIYITTLNLLALGISIKKNWKIVRYISFALNTIVTTPLIGVIIYNNYWNFATIIVYTSLLYIIYLITAVYYSIKNNLKITIYENILFILNTLIHGSITFFVFSIYFPKHLGYFAILLFSFFFTIGRLIENVTKGEKVISNMLFCTAFGFSYMAIPIQFGGNIAYISIVLQSTVLTLIGIYKNRYVYQILGAIGLIISTINIGYAFDNYINIFSLLSGNIAVIGMFYYMATTGDKRNTKVISSKEFKVYKVFTLLIAYVFLISVTNHIDYYIYNLNMKNYFSIIIVLFSILNILIVNIKIIHGDELNIAMLGVSTFLLMTSFIIDKDVNIIIFILSKIIYLYSIYKILEMTIIEKDNLYAIFSIINLFIIPYIFVELELIEINDLYFSLMCMFNCCVFIIIGFYHNYSKLRKMMLCGVYLFLFKIFIFDIMNSGASKVISFILFGVILIFISYLYQKFTKLILNDIDLSDDK